VRATESGLLRGSEGPRLPRRRAQTVQMRPSAPGDLEGTGQVQPPGSATVLLIVDVCAEGVPLTKRSAKGLPMTSRAFLPFTLRPTCSSYSGRRPRVNPYWTENVPQVCEVKAEDALVQGLLLEVNSSDGEYNGREVFRVYRDIPREVPGYSDTLEGELRLLPCHHAVEARPKGVGAGGVYRRRLH